MHSKTLEIEEAVEKVEYKKSESDAAVRLSSVFLMDDQQRILLVLNRYSHQWTLPEAEIRCGESTVQAVKRFMKDDFGVEAYIHGCLYVDYSIDRHEGLDQMRTTFFATLKSPPADLIDCISLEVGEFCLTSLEDLDKFPCELGLYRMMMVMARQQQFLPMPPEHESELISTDSTV